MKVSRFQWNAEDPHALATEVRDLQPPLSEVTSDVAAIIDEVAQRGDKAVLKYEGEFGAARPANLRVPDEEIADALDDSPDLRPSLEAAARAIEAVAMAEAAAESPSRAEGEFGQVIETTGVAVESAGAYVPGGAAAYPSSVLMCCIPARVAGTERVVVASPPGPEGAVNRAVLAAAAIAGADEVFAMGGAQAIAALTFGTDTVRSVDIVVGPGNRYVQEAKRQVFGRVGIDGIAGPSELMVVVDDTSDLRLVALDLCAQAEHGSDGLLVAAAVKQETLDALAREIEELANDPEREIAESPLALVRVPNLQAAITLANDLAPEHLELALEEGSEVLAKQVRYAGCVFVGRLAATAFGDYAAGSNHVLPTGGAGRFSGPLGPRAFRRRLATVSIPETAVSQLALLTDTLARAEGFPVHGESATARGGDIVTGGEPL